MFPASGSGCQLRGPGSSARRHSGAGCGRELGPRCVEAAGGRGRAHPAKRVGAALLPGRRAAAPRPRSPPGQGRPHFEEVFDAR